MKFGKALEKALVEDQIPEQWISKSIQYKPLKKSINRVVDEMEQIGLSRDIAKDLHLYYEFEQLGDDLGSKLKLEDDRDETESIRSRRLKMESDTKFFNELYHQWQELVKFNNLTEGELMKRIQMISQLISKLTSGSQRNKNDMYLWREIFNQYVDFKLDLKSHFTRKNLNQYLKHVTDLKLLKSFRHTKQNTKYFQMFYELNLELLQFLHFENLNSIAVRKIIKKFDKHTKLKSGTNLSKMIVFQKSRLSTSTIEQIVATDIVKIMPQLDDYLCPICFTLAWKPVRLSCSHFFCIRCLIKLQRCGEKKCPMCRDPVVMDATEMNVDYELIELMRENFPSEVKQKKRQNDKEVTDETLSELYGHGQCIIM